MINLLIKIWQWFDNKKTIIGSFFLIISAFCTQVLIGIWNASWDWLPLLIQTFDWIGMVLGGTGLIHKAYKSRNSE